MAEKYDRGKIIQTYAELVTKVSRNIENPVDIWLIGNTGIRNPWRIPSGFKVYAESNMVGKLRSQEEQVAFKMLLMEKGEIGGALKKIKVQVLPVSIDLCLTSTDLLIQR